MYSMEPHGGLSVARASPTAPGRGAGGVVCWSWWSTWRFARCESRPRVPRAREEMVAMLAQTWPGTASLAWCAARICGAVRGPDAWAPPASSDGIPSLEGPPFGGRRRRWKRRPWLERGEGGSTRARRLDASPGSTRAWQRAVLTGSGSGGSAALLCPGRVCPSLWSWSFVLCGVHWRRPFGGGSSSGSGTWEEIPLPSGLFAWW